MKMSLLKFKIVLYTNVILLEFNQILYSNLNFDILIFYNLGKAGVSFLLII